jgi:hypothetical protein
MNEEQPAAEEGGISTRTVEYVVALLLFVFGSVIVFDSQRLGSSSAFRRWRPHCKC